MDIRSLFMVKNNLFLKQYQKLRIVLKTQDLNKKNGVLTK